MVRHLNARERRALADASHTDFVGDEDWERRLRNAMIALVQSDSKWMVWLEKEICPEMPIDEAVRLIETRARFLALRGFRYTLGDRITALALNDRWRFTDRGTLPPGPQ